MNSEVRRIRADEGLQLRVLRLRALADAPMAFGSTLAREEAFPEHVWHTRAVEGASGTGRVTFIAEREGQWLGLATGVASDPIKPDDPGPVLVGMFVDPAERGRGLGAALVEAVVAWARSRGARGLSLWVTSSNGPAICERRAGSQLGRSAVAARRTTGSESCSERSTSSVAGGRVGSSRRLKAEARTIGAKLGSAMTVASNRSAPAWCRRPAARASA